MKDKYSSCEDLDNAVDTFPVSVSVDGTWQKKRYGHSSLLDTIDRQPLKYDRIF